MFFSVPGAASVFLFFLLTRTATQRIAATVFRWFFCFSVRFDYILILLKGNDWTKNDSHVFGAIIFSLRLRMTKAPPSEYRFSSLIPIKWNSLSSFRIATFSVINWKIENSFRSAHRLPLACLLTSYRHLPAMKCMQHRCSWKSEKKKRRQKMANTNRFCECNEMRMRIDELGLIWIHVDASFPLFRFGIEMAGCCWLLHLSNRRKLQNVFGSYDLRNECIYRSE